VSDRIDDGYGDTVAAYDRWAHALANDLLPPAHPDHDDLVQEGRLAMLRALDTYDQAKGALPSWLTGAARMRMRAMAHGSDQWTGRPPTRGSRSVEATSLDALLDAPGAANLVAAAPDLLDGALLAYHDGQIAAALDRLTDDQRTYVVLRFWGGLDPASRDPVVRDLMAAHPVMRDRTVWPAARAVLADALAHLA
jgi:DNA-directed RNA polymerase specialized sigma24 family protein